MSIKKSYVILSLLVLLLMSGCASKKGNTEVAKNAKATPAIPVGAVKACTGNTIKLNDITLTLPASMKYGKKEDKNGVSYYVWKDNDNYILPSSVDVLLFIYEGCDKKTPDKELNESEVRSSISNYTQQFISDIENAHITLDAGITNNAEWYTECFTGYGGNNYEITSYGKYCYPKSYYGVYMLQKNITVDYSRKYYGFVFSNDKMGEILSEDEYNTLFNQIKDNFKVKNFYSLPQLNPDPSKDFSKGYSYKQLEELFKDTKNYYIIAGKKAAQ